MSVKPTKSYWFVEMGFEESHSPGVSRAWRYQFADGSFVLVTDVGGYDLPPLRGPYSGMHLSAQLELLDIAPLVRSTRDLYRWLRHRQRKQRFERWRQAGVLPLSLQPAVAEFMTL